MCKMRSMRESTNFRILEEDSNSQLREDRDLSEHSEIARYRSSQSS